MSPALEHLKSNSLRLNAERHAHNALTTHLADKITEAAIALAHAERTFGLQSDQAVSARAALRKLKQDRAKLPSPVLIDPLNEVETYLAQSPKAQPAEAVVPDIKPGETPLAAYNRRQEVTASVLKTIRGLETAPADPEELAAPLFDQIDELAKRGAPRVVNGRLGFPQKLAGVAGVDDAVALIAFIDGDRFKKAVGAMLKRSADGPTMTADDRASALAKAFRELVEALRQEAAVAVEAERAGQRVVRRRNIHPAVLLGLRIAPAVAYAYLAKGGRP
ncbi:MAG TPA: hypothetical protein VIJ06_01200 [Methylovirgula sp.]